MPEFVGRLRTPRLASAPASPVVGEMYYDTAVNKLFWWNGTVWTGTDMVYNGSHVPATAYKDGDIVVSNGIAYLCVRPTTANPSTWPQSTAYPDTTGKLNNVLTVTTGGAAPTWQAPAPQGADLVYNGAFPANTPYTDGDIVIQNGVAYMCVRPTSATPTPWASAPVPVAYATTLPTSPYNGQEAVLVDSLTAPTYTWRFRYNAGSSSAYKWEFIGGSRTFGEVAPSTAQEVLTSVTFTNLSTVGPQFTVPRAGEYEISFGADVQNSIGNYGLVGPKLGAAAVSDLDAVNCYGANYNEVGIARTIKRTLAASDVVLLQYRSSAAGQNAWFRFRWLQVQPVRVS